MKSGLLLCALRVTALPAFRKHPQPCFCRCVAAAFLIIRPRFLYVPGALIDHADVIICHKTVYAIHGKLFHGSSFFELGNGGVEKAVIHINQPHQKDEVRSYRKSVIELGESQRVPVAFEV